MSIPIPQVEAVRASLKEWMTLDVSVGGIEEWMLPALVGKGGREIRRLMQRIGGVPLRVHGGFVKGRAGSAKDAAAAIKIVQERVRKTVVPIVNWPINEQRREMGGQVCNTAHSVEKSASVPETLVDACSFKKLSKIV